MPESLRLRFADGTQMVCAAHPVLALGRREEGNQQQIDIDLAHFQGISRLHAFLFIEAERVFLQDFNSRNGTLLNGYELIPLKSYRVNSGDNIQLGRANFTLDLA